MQDPLKVSQLLGDEPRFGCSTFSTKTPTPCVDQRLLAIPVGCCRLARSSKAPAVLVISSKLYDLYGVSESLESNAELRSVSRRRQQQGRVPLWQGLCMKVAPPRCPELRVGVLACRILGQTILLVAYVKGGQQAVCVFFFFFKFFSPQFGVWVHNETVADQKDAGKHDKSTRNHENAL